MLGLEMNKKLKILEKLTGKLKEKLFLLEIKEDVDHAGLSLVLMLLLLPSLFKPVVLLNYFLLNI